MGLRQTFKFKYKDIDEVISFIKNFSETYQVENRNGLYIIKNNDSDNFIFDVFIEPYGLCTERAGEYFEFFGVFVETLTGNFGAVVIEDI